MVDYQNMCSDAVNETFCGRQLHGKMPFEVILFLKQYESQKLEQ